MNALENADPETLQKTCPENIANLIIKNRTGDLEVSPGYDGVYGALSSEKSAKSGQSSLTKF